MTISNLPSILNPVWNSPRPYNSLRVSSTSMAFSEASRASTNVGHYLALLIKMSLICSIFVVCHLGDLRGPTLPVLLIYCTDILLQNAEKGFPHAL